MLFCDSAADKQHLGERESLLSLGLFETSLDLPDVGGKESGYLLLKAMPKPKQANLRTGFLRNSGLDDSAGEVLLQELRIQLVIQAPAALALHLERARG